MIIQPQGFYIMYRKSFISRVDLISIFFFFFAYQVDLRKNPLKSFPLVVFEETTRGDEWKNYAGYSQKSLKHFFFKC